MTNPYASRVPDDVMRAAKEAAKRNGTSPNRLFLAAIAEKVGADRTEALFRSYAGRADMATLQRILARVPNAPPVPDDELADEPAG